MADRDWDKEMAKIDKQLASISDEALVGKRAVQAGRGGKALAADQARQRRHDRGMEQGLPDAGAQREQDHQRERASCRSDTAGHWRTLYKTAVAPRAPAPARCGQQPDREC